MKVNRVPLRYGLPAILLIGSVLIALFSYKYNVTIVTQEIYQKAKRDALGLHIRDELEYALQRGDSAFINYIVAGLGVVPDIIGSYFVDDKGVVLAATDLSIIGGYYSPPIVFSDQPAGLSPDVIVNDKTVYTRFPILLGLAPDEMRSMRIGNLYVQTDLTHRLQESRRHIENQALTFSGFILVIALMIWIYFHNVVGKRISRLQLAAFKIGVGEHGVQADLELGDELGDLAQSFNSMAARLDKQQAHLEALQQAINEHAIVSITDVGGRITYVNDRFCKISKYSHYELLGQNHRLIKSDAHEDVFYQELWQTISSGKIWHGLIQNRNKHGKSYWVQSSIVPIVNDKGSLTQYISIRTDVTQHERLRLAMGYLAIANVGKESYDTIARALSVGLDKRCAGFGWFMNHGQELEILGLWVDDAIGDKFVCTSSSNPCGDVYQRSAAVVVADNVIDQYPESQFLAGLGAVSFHGEPLYDEDGNVFGVIFVVDDKPSSENREDCTLLHLAAERAVLEYRRAVYEGELRESKMQLAEAQRMAKLGSWTLDLINGDLAWSDEVFHIFEIDQSRFGASYEAFLDAIHPDDRNMVDAKYQEAVKTKSPYSVVHRLLMKDGRIKWVHERGESYYDAEENPVQSIGYVHDVTERKEAENDRERLQQQLQQSQKMETIGHLTGGIAHDFNNILTSIIGFTSLLIERYTADQDAKLYKYLQLIYQAGIRGRDLVSQMLAFGRVDPGRQELVAPAMLINEVVGMLGSTIPASINVETHVNETAALVFADTVKLHQVITNLVINARDAIGEYGHIKLRVGESTIDERICSSCYQKFSGNYVEIAVQDDGMGIKADQIVRIFEPFFSTKEVGRGSGMGLAMVHGIMHQCNGHVLVESTPGVGTEFRLCFPFKEVEQQNAGDLIHLPDSMALAESTVAGSTVLVVDDEASVSEFIFELVSGLGCTVYNFTDPLAALAKFESDPDAIDLVITDQTMPQMTGAELAGKLLSLRPELPIILCTGYSASIDEDGAHKLGIADYMKKPIAVGTLVQSLVRLLSAKK